MHKSSGRYSDSDEEGGDDTMNEQELQRLQRQYRRLAGDRRAYTETSQNVIRKQRCLIESLQSENQEIRTNLENTDSIQNQSKDKEVTTQLQDLVITNDDYINDIAAEKEKIQELDDQIRALERDTKRQHKNMGGVHQSHAHHTTTRKNIRVLENRLDKSMGNFNKQLTRNKELRQEIDHLRQERKRFDNMYKNLAKELEKCKQEMAKVIEDATQAYEQRDEYQAKIVQIDDRNQKDQAQHDIEMKELERIISHDNKLKEFMNIKSADRADYKAEEADKKKRKGDGDKAIDDDRRFVETAEEAFEHIKEITGEDDLDIIVNDFITKEDNNFALFNYVNELSNEEEVLAEQNEQLKLEMERYHHEDVRNDEKRAVKMKELEVLLAQASEEADRDEERLTQVNKVLDQLKVGTLSMFDKIGCDKKPIDDLLGNQSDETQVKDSNMMIYLGLIEQKANELLAIQHYCDMRMYQTEVVDEPPPGGAVLGLTKKPPQTQPVTIVPPTTGDDLYDEGSTDDEEDHPFTREEIKSKVMRGIVRKEPHGSANKSYNREKKKSKD